MKTKKKSAPRRRVVRKRAAPRKKRAAPHSDKTAPITDFLLLYVVTLLLCMIGRRVTIAAVQRMMASGKESPVRRFVADVRFTTALRALAVLGMTTTAFSASRTQWSTLKRVGVGLTGLSVVASPLMLALPQALKLLWATIALYLDVDAEHGPDADPRVWAGEMQVCIADLSQARQPTEFEHHKQHLLALLDRLHPYIPFYVQAYACMHILKRVGLTFVGPTGTLWQQLMSCMQLIMVFRDFDPDKFAWNAYASNTRRCSITEYIQEGAHPQ